MRTWCVSTPGHFGDHLLRGPRRLRDRIRFARPELTHPSGVLVSATLEMGDTIAYVSLAPGRCRGACGQW